MPTLSKIIVRDFRNIELQELDFSPNVNCIAGGNGEGKTNLLDAIWCLSMTKGAFGAADADNVRYGTDGFALSGVYDMDGTEVRFAVQYGAEGKKVSRDGKPYGRISDHIGVLPVVMVSPADISLVSESGEERRRFVNSVLSQMDREYLSAVQQFTKLLARRNKILKDKPDDTLLDALDAMMAGYSESIRAKRTAFVEALSPIVADYYSRISGGRESVGIEYRCDCPAGGFEAMLKSRRDRDRYLGYTGAGVQRDDFLFTMDGNPIRRHGSQGQQKSFLVALKFAQYDIMKKAYGFAPTLLLDDLFDKLDYGRISNLLKMVAGEDFGQIFLSDCDSARIQRTLDGITAERTYYNASGGCFTLQEPNTDK